MSEEKDTNQLNSLVLKNNWLILIECRLHKLLILDCNQPKTPVYHLSEVVQELESFFTEEFKKNAGESVPDEAVKLMFYS